VQASQGERTVAVKVTAFRWMLEILILFDFFFFSTSSVTSCLYS
jgi:hypothetical protein